MPPDRVHEGVCFRMSDVKLVAPLFLDKVSVGGVPSKVACERSTPSVQKALANSRLRNQGPGTVGDAVVCFEVKLEEGGFCNRWFLGYLGPIQL